MGGENIKKANNDLIYDYGSLKTFGFSSSIFSFVRNYKIYRKIVRVIHKIRPEIFIAVAYPGLNLLLCRYAKKIGAKVIYLLPPQIWVWGSFRKYFIKKWTDLVISIFPFEHQFYNNENIKVSYWQNPLFEELKKYKRTDYKKKIGLMPGSRKNEIKRNLPVMIEVIQNFERNSQEQFHNIEYFLILHPDSLSCEIFHYLDNHHLFAILHSGEKIKRPNPNLITITQNRYQAMCDCDLLIICSGTASLEAAIMKIPQIFFNRPNFFDYHLFRYLIKIKEYNLANLHAEKKVVPSFVMRNKNVLLKKILFELNKILTEKEINA